MHVDIKLWNVHLERHLFVALNWWLLYKQKCDSHLRDYLQVITTVVRESTLSVLCFLYFCQSLLTFYVCVELITILLKEKYGVANFQLFINYICLPLRLPLLITYFPVYWHCYPEENSIEILLVQLIIIEQVQKKFYK